MKEQSEVNNKEMGRNTHMDHKLDLNKLIDYKGSGEEWEPKLRLPFSLDTEYIKRDFLLDIVVWKLTSENLEQTQRVVRYILENFSRLFETAWTAFYHMYENNVDCTLAEFFQQIDFEPSLYYTIRIEINSDSLADGEARYHFVVHTDADLSDDDIRLYMRDNQCCATDTNNDSGVIQESADFGNIYNPEVAEAVRKAFEKAYEKMKQEQMVSLAPSFCG